ERFGNGIVSFGSPARGYHSPSKVSKLTLLTPEEMKKSGNMKRAPCESASHVSFTIVAVTFLS
ncbi:hypothetical protein HN51_011441, partial [Arachis hypogaea]